MTISVEEFTRLKKNAERKQREHDEAAGSLKTLMAQLEKEFKADSKEEGIEQLKELDQRQSKLEKQFEEQLEELQKEHGEELQ